MKKSNIDGNIVKNRLNLFLVAVTAHYIFNKSYKIHKFE